MRSESTRARNEATLRAYLANDPKAGKLIRADVDYVSTFENEHGERWVYLHQDDESVGSLAGEDVGWKLHRVEKGVAVNMNLSQAEGEWIEACWKAATFGHIKPPAEPAKSRATDHARELRAFAAAMIAAGGPKNTSAGPLVQVLYDAADEIDRLRAKALGQGESS